MEYLAVMPDGFMLDFYGNPYKEDFILLYTRSELEALRKRYRTQYGPDCEPYSDLCQEYLVLTKIL